jgi:hypothetical protein
MTTPLTTQQRDDYDAIPYVVDTYLYVDQSPSVLVADIGSVNENATAYESIDTGTVQSGSLSDVKEGMTIVLTASDGTPHGQQRVRGVSGTTINIGRAPRGDLVGEMRPTSGDTVTVYDSRLPFQKVPFIADDGTQYKDTLAYPGANEAQPLVANCDSVKFNLGDGSAHTFSFDGTGSFAVRSGASISSYSWDIADGTVQTGTTSDSSLTVSFPQGRRYVRLTVTDSNGVTGFQDCLVVNETEANLLKAELTDIERTLTETTARIETTLDYFDNSYRLNAPCIIAQNDDIMGSNVRLYGWLGEQNVRLADARNGIWRTTITVNGIANRLRTLGAFPQTVSTASDATGTWYALPEVNIDRLIHHMLQWHSNALEIVRFDWSGLGSSYPLPELNTQGDELFDQFDQLAQAIAHRLTVNETGHIQCLPDERVVPSTSQLSAAPANKATSVLTTLTQDDYTEERFLYNPDPPVRWLKADAVVASSTAGEISALKARAPSLTPGQGTNTPTYSNQLVTSANATDELLWRTGNQYAVIEANPYGELELRLVKTRAIFDPAEMQLVNINLEADIENTYGVADSDTWLVTGTTETYNARSGRKDVRLRAVRVVDGVKAQYEPIPEERVTDGINLGTDLDLSFPDFELSLNTDLVTDVNPVVNLSGVSANLVLILSNGRVAVTSNADDANANVNWTLNDHSATIGTDIRAWVVRTGGTQARGWIVADAKIWYAENLQNASPTFTDQTPSGFSGSFGRADADWRFTGGDVVAVTANGGRVFVSTDAGATWTEYTGYGSQSDMTIHMSAGTAGELFVSNDNGNFTSDVLRSANYGATKSVILNNISGSEPEQLYLGASSPKILFYGSNGSLYRYNIDTGVSSAAINAGGVNTQRNEYHRSVISVDHNDANKVAYAASGSGLYAYITDNGLAASPLWRQLATESGATQLREVALVNGGDSVYAWGDNGKIWYAGDTNDGDILTSLRGDLSTSADVRGVAGY